jgi:hypothetical protein
MDTPVHTTTMDTIHAMDNMERLFSLSDTEWVFYTLNRLNVCIFQNQEQHLAHELIRQIFLEFEFRRDIYDIINTL